MNLIKKIRKSYVLSAGLLVFALLAPIFRNDAYFRDDSPELRQVKAALSALHPNMDLHWRNELAALVVETAREFQVPADYQLNDKPLNKPAFIISQMWVESRFNPRARSHSNAQGLMQVKPSTGRLIAPGLGIPRQEEYYHPGQNLRLGVAYMNDLMKIFKNDLRDATYAYNIGPAAYKKGRKLRSYWIKIVDTYSKIAGI